MSERVRKADVERAMAAHVRALESYGLLGDDVYEVGQPFGATWNLYRRVAGTGGIERPLIGAMMVGDTPRGAYDTIVDRTGALHDVMSALKAQGRVS